MRCMSLACDDNYTLLSNAPVTTMALEGPTKVENNQLLGAHAESTLGLHASYEDLASTKKVLLHSHHSLALTGSGLAHLYMSLMGLLHYA